MILSYNWQIIEKIPNSQAQLSQMVKIPSLEDQQPLGSQSPNNTIHPTSLHRPLFGFLFCYYIEEPKINPPKLQILPTIMLLQQIIQSRVIRQERCKNGIFLQVLIESSQIHDVLMTLTVRINYHSGQKPLKIGSISNLVRLTGNRQLNLSPAVTYATIRKDLIIQSPVSIDHKYQKEGYLLIKVIRSEDAAEEVQIVKVEVMNWLATGNEGLKRDIVQGLLNDPFKLRSKETYTLPFKMNNNLVGVQMPIAISYCFPEEKRIFKMVRMIRGDNNE